MEKAWAKVNLTLDIIGRRDDGYHNMEMVMQTVNLADEVSLQFVEKSGITVESNLSFLPTGADNIAGKSAGIFWKEMGIPSEGLHITVEKNIPVCAGLAGGSSDGAAVLRLLNEHYGSPATLEQLSNLSQKIGADLPFCVQGGTAFVEGIGEQVTPLSPLPFCHILLCKPRFSIATPGLFRKISKQKIRFHPDTVGMLRAVDEGDLEGISCRLFNVFESALVGNHLKTVEEIKKTLLDQGALGCTMSGSGPTVFGIFADLEKAKMAEHILQKDFPETFLTEPV